MWAQVGDQSGLTWPSSAYLLQDYPHPPMQNPRARAISLWGVARSSATSAAVGIPSSETSSEVGMPLWARLLTQSSLCERSEIGEVAPLGWRGQERAGVSAGKGRLQHQETKDRAGVQETLVVDPTSRR